MKKYHNNPRQIKEKNFLELKKSLEEFGDLSGIVHNLDTDEILSGNQRFEALNLNDYEEKITERFDPPTPGGTCAIGQIMINGEPYKVIHKTGWSEEKCRRAVLAANSRKLQGETDFDILSNWDEKIVLEYFEEWELGLGEGATSTDRDGQGVASTWDQVEKSGFVPVKIGDIESRITVECYQKLKNYADNNFNKDIPVYNTIESVLIKGIYENSDS